MKEYTCECGKKFDNPQKFNGHKCHCKIHRKAVDKPLIEIGKNILSHQKAAESLKHNSQLKKKQQLDQWISEKHVCEHCGKVMTEKFGSGRFCCRACANTRKQSTEVNAKRHLTLLGRVTNKKAVEARIARQKDIYYQNPKFCPICGTLIKYEKRFNKFCSQECARKNISNIAKENIFGNYGGFIWDNRKIIYKGIKLDSSYELAVAQDLDLHNIKWQRCKRFKYIVDGQVHHYTPDFYLPEFNIYLDPKNDYLINNINKALGYTDSEKIKMVSDQNNIKIFILDKDHLNWESIKLLLENN